MAPTAPTSALMSGHRAKAFARLADPTLPRKVHREGSSVTDSFLHSKRDKQRIRKSSFRARVEEQAAKSGRGRKPLKRRRPSKKLVTTLESLADALPEVDARGSTLGADLETEWQGIKRRTTSSKNSLRTRPGALKRKEKLVHEEITRFDANLAQLMETAQTEVIKEVNRPAEKQAPAEAAAMDDSDDTPKEMAPSTAKRWAMLRNFISSTMEQNPAFTSS